MKHKHLAGLAKADKIITTMFFLSTAFFLYQHSTGFSWDFSTYTMNAQYLTGQGSYFEWGRPPLPSLIMLPLGMLGWLAAEYLYITLISILFLYSAIKFASSFKINKTAFYVFSMSAFTLTFGMKMGTELLFLSLTQLFFASLFENRKQIGKKSASIFSGVFYSLSVLTRHTGVQYAIFLLIKKKKIFIALTAALIIALPWLLYSYIKTGNPAIGFIDSYALNFTQRIAAGLSSPLLASDLLFTLNFTIPLAFIGLFSKHDKFYWTMAALAILAVFSFSAIPLKETRYLIGLATPAAFFAAKGIEQLNNYRNQIIAAFVIASFAALVFLPADVRDMEDPGMYKEIADSGINCMTKSNVWVPLNYYGMASEPFPERTQLQDSIENGYVIIIQKGAAYLEYAKDIKFMRGFPMIRETDGYIILGNASNCKQPQRFELIFVDRVHDYYKTTGRNGTKCEIALPGWVCGLL